MFFAGRTLAPHASAGVETNSYMMNFCDRSYFA